MFLDAKHSVFENARTLRENQTNAEQILWDYLKERPLGYKFRRQHPVSFYIADFYCHVLKLIIEVDGSIHNDIEIRRNDKLRQEELEAAGMIFLRFTNDEVEQHIPTVKTTIEAFLLKSGIPPFKADKTGQKTTG